MAFVCVNAVLMSGRGTWITARCDWTVGELKRQAQNSLQTGPGILVSASGEFLRDEENLLDAGVKMGDIVSLHLRDVHIAATTNAFCAVPWRDDMTPRGRGPVPLCSVSLHNGTLSPFSVLFCSLRFSATDVS